MRVLITGNDGYIGPIMVGLFRQAGHYVGGLDTGFYSSGGAVEDPQMRPHAQILKDLRQIDRDDLKGFDCIVHLAALSNDPLGELAPELTAQINYQATVDIARCAKEAGVRRFIYASSCSLYGAASTDSPLTEEAAFNPVSAYAVSKVEAERELRTLADDLFTPVYMRNATAYGVSPRMRFDLVLNNLVAWARTTGTIRVMSDGTPWRPLVHIRDISLAALCAAVAPRASVHDQAFNVGRDDANYRVRDIAEAVARAAPDSQLQITGETAGDARSYRVSFRKIAERLPGFAPAWDIAKGCEELVRWFDGRRETVDSFQSRHFIRLKQLKHLIGEGRLNPELYWQ